MKESTIDLLNRINSLLTGDGHHFDIGCSMDESESAIKRWTRKEIDKPIRAVTQWQWWDYERPESHPLPECSISAVIYADNLLYDSEGFFTPGSPVRTSRIERIHDEYVMETQNRFYILVGPGVRKRTDIHTIMSIIL